MSPERWLAVSVGSLSEEEDALLAEGLLALGGGAVQEADGRLVTYLPGPVDAREVRRKAVRALAKLTGRDTVDVRATWREHEDWSEAWKRGLGPRRVTPRLVVTPSWETPGTRPGDVVVVLDPGAAFGTAEHGTTRGCLRLLDRALAPGERVLDVGTGSAVLAVAAALLGAGEVLAVEGDPVGCEVARENVERNGVSDRVRVSEGWATTASLAASGPFDGVLANLETGRLRGLMAGLVGAVTAGGWAILGGILDGELDDVLRDAASVGLVREALDRDGPWRSALLRRA